MNTLKINNEELAMKAFVESENRVNRSVNYVPFILLGLLLLLWPILQHFIMRGAPNVAYLDPNIWLLVLLSLICFLISIGLCWWLLQQFWTSIGLPSIGDMVLQFKQLQGWQQLGFYWASFGFLLLAAVGVLIAIL
ncbi:hypothetical protein [Pedobacter nyackensis]|uniref:hypothetical protein n=1 Tax=Pedobacter nyackensis TaxID=475255 RepID=UPI000A05DA56|nr:hypothetical protein [Pedobacter nyackensis]